MNLGEVSRVRCRYEGVAPINYESKTRAGPIDLDTFSLVVRPNVLCVRKIGTGKN